MFTLEGFQGPGRGLVRAEVTQALVKDAHGNPVVLVVEHGGALQVSVAGDEDFPEAVRRLGFTLDVRPLRGPGG